MEVVKDFTDVKSVRDLIEGYISSGGFQAKHLGLAVEYLEEMIKEAKIRFLSFPACIIATGSRGIIKEFVKRKWFNVVVTTTGTLDHDLARLLASYYHGSFNANDLELQKEGILRLGNIFIPERNYGFVLEKFMKEFFEWIDEGEYSSHELVWEVGRFLEDRDFERKEESITYWAYKNKIPVIIPGFYDGAFGFQIWFNNKRKKKININLEKDEDLLSEYGFSEEKSGALIIGGGISKHHVIWWNQFKGGLDYAIYITTAVEWDGSLSGAQEREAITWKKVKPTSKRVTVYSDATIVLPIIYWYLKETLF
jgi:deoxyhypusine synthase